MDYQTVLDRAFDRNQGTAIRQRRDADADRELSFREIADDVRGIAAGLQEYHGLEEGDRIGVYTGNDLDAFRLLLGAWYAGITVVEVKPRTTAANIGYYLDDAGTDLLFHAPGLAGRVEDADLDTETVPITRDSIDELHVRADRGDVPPIDEETFSAIGYTSGTTGRPKGVPTTHARTLTTVMVLLTRGEVRDDDRVGLIYPYYGVGNLELTASLMTGATLVLPEDREPRTVLDMVTEEEITSIGGVPTQLKDLAAAHDPDRHDTSSIRYVHTGSGLMTETVYEQVEEVLDPETFCTSYGSSEAGETVYSLKDSTAIGKPTYFQRVRLVEPGSKDPGAVAEDEGELIVDADGPEVFKGYLNRPEATEEALIDGWYFTGDVLRRDDDGDLWFQGRVDDLIVSGGENISPGSVESVLHDHPQVHEGGAIGVPSERWGEKVVAVVEADDTLTAAELDAFFQDSSLEDFKRPKEYLFVDEIPTYDTGGVVRAELRELWREREGED